MIDYIFKAKHWQVFLVLFGIPFLCQFGFIFYSGQIFDQWKGEQPGPEELLNILEVFRIAIYLSPIFIIINFLYFYGVGKGLKRHLPEFSNLKFKRFAGCLITAFLIQGIATAFAGFIVEKFLLKAIEASKPDTNFLLSESGQVFNLGLFFGILIISLLSFALMLYLYYYLGKSLKSAELGKNPKGDEFIGYFFLFWFFYVGVWLIQPKLNKIASLPTAPPEISED